MKNSMQDLNNHLFAQLERLNDEDLTSAQLEIECNRAKAISSLAKNLAENAKIELAAREFATENSVDELPNMLQPKSPALHGVKTK